LFGLQSSRDSLIGIREWKETASVPIWGFSLANHAMFVSFNDPNKVRGQIDTLATLKSAATCRLRAILNILLLNKGQWPNDERADAREIISLRRASEVNPSFAKTNAGRHHRHPLREVPFSSSPRNFLPSHHGLRIRSNYKDTQA
jgi:hypothetical protein